MTSLAQFFTQDHRDCDAQWAKLEQLLDGGDAAALSAAWSEFEGSMRRHLAMEEEVLFPAFEAASGMSGCGPTEVMRHEHVQMRGVLEQIGDAIADGDLQEALDQGDTLLMLIQQHNVKEEGMLYRMAEQMLGHDWEALRERLSAYSRTAG